MGTILDECESEEARKMDEWVELTKKGTLLATDTHDICGEPHGFEIFAVPEGSIDTIYIGWDHHVNVGRYPWEVDGIGEDSLAEVLFRIAGEKNRKYRTPAGDELVRRAGEALLVAAAAIMNDCIPGRFNALHLGLDLPSGAPRIANGEDPNPTPTETQIAAG
jgi:hypothetical protein